MKPLRHLVSIVCIGASCLGNAGDPQAASALDAPGPAKVVDLLMLQGKWEGVEVGDAARQKIIITINGNSLHFHRDTNFWFDTTVTFRAGKDPRELNATIRNSSPPTNSIGQIVRAAFKLEGGTLTLVPLADDADDSANVFEAGGSRYELRKVPTQRTGTQPPKA
ncbi:MAG: hypothetical protein AB7O66_17580 [Limisphaerales bacterium]